VSKLKFEQEIKQKIKSKQNVLKGLEKDQDPIITNEWVPAGPLIPCNGCGKTYTEKSGARGERVGAAVIIFKIILGRT
jgi:lysyl-tRNA synthetase class I